MELGQRLAVVAPDEQVAVGGDARGGLGSGSGDLVFLRLCGVIAEIPALEVDGVPRGVVEFQPVAALEVVVLVDIVGRHDLVDAHFGDALAASFAAGHAPEAGLDVEIRAGRQVELQVAGDVLRVACVAPSDEAVAATGFGLQAHGGKELARVFAVGHEDVVHIDVAPLGVGAQMHLLGCDVGQLHTLVLLHLLGHRGSAVLEFAADFFQRAVGAGPLLRHGGAHAVAQLIEDGGGALGVEDAAHQAEGGGELAAEVGVLHQVHEEGAELDLAVAALGGVVDVVIAVPLHTVDPAEGVAADGDLALLVHAPAIRAESGIEVEEGDAEAPVGSLAVGLQVVVGPVPGAEVQLCGHVVHELVHVHQRADLVVHGSVGAVGREVIEVQQRLAGAQHHIGAGVGALLVDFHVVLRDAEVGEAEVLVVRLAQVDEAHVAPVDVVDHGLVGHHVEVDARAAYDLVQGSILDAGAAVVAAAAHLQRLVADVGFVREEGIVHGVLALIDAVGLELEGLGVVSAGPAAADAEVHVLVEDHVVLPGHHVLEVDGPVPVHVPVDGRGLAVARAAVHAADIDADAVVVEVFIWTGDIDDGQQVLAFAF